MARSKFTAGWNVFILHHPADGAVIGQVWCKVCFIEAKAYCIGRKGDGLLSREVKGLCSWKRKDKFSKAAAILTDETRKNGN